MPPSRRAGMCSARSTKQYGAGDSWLELPAPKLFHRFSVSLCSATRSGRVYKDPWKGRRTTRGVPRTCAECYLFFHF
jgi:hypothetical protein